MLCSWVKSLRTDVTATHSTCGQDRNWTSQLLMVGQIRCKLRYPEDSGVKQHGLQPSNDLWLHEIHLWKSLTQLYYFSLFSQLEAFLLTRLRFYWFRVYTTQKVNSVTLCWDKTTWRRVNLWMRGLWKHRSSDNDRIRHIQRQRALRACKGQKGDEFSQVALFGGNKSIQMSFWVVLL